MPQANTPIQATSATFRKTAAGVKLGQILFDPKLQSQISPSQISGLLKSAGFNVGKTATVTADVAQVIMAGGAYASAAATADTIQSIANPAIGVLNAVSQLLGDSGLISPNSPPMAMLRLGTDAILVCASAGLNPIADIAFIFDLLGIGNILGGPDIQGIINLQKKLNADAKDINQTTFNAKIKTESKSAANLITDFHSGKIGFFSMLGDIASQSPELFYNYFPDMGAFLPPVTTQQTVITYGGTQNDYIASFGPLPKGAIFVQDMSFGMWTTVGGARVWIANRSIVGQNSISYKTAGTYSKQNVEDALFQKYIIGPYEPYRLLDSLSKQASYINQYGYPPKSAGIGPFDPKYRVIPRISLSDISSLSLMPPYFDYLRDDFDLRKSLVALGLTPNDLGYGQSLMNIAHAHDFLPQQLTLPPAVTFNGVDYFTPPETISNKNITSSNAKATASNISLSNAIQGDLDGDIQKTLSNSTYSSMIQELGILPYLSDSQLKACGGDYATNTLTTNSYRNIRNYWGLISMLDKMTKDGYFNDSYSATRFQSFHAYIPKIDDITTRVQNLQALTISRQANKLAKENIASFYKTTSDKITVNPGRNGSLASVTLH